MTKYLHLLEPRIANVVQDASILRRVLALCIDILLLDLIVTAPWTNFFATLLERTKDQNILTITYTQQELAAIMLLFVFVYAYFVLFEYLLAQTPGMMLANISVHTPPKLWQSLVRNCFLIPTLPFVILWVVEPISVALYRRSILERLSGTRTIHTQSIIV